MRVIGLVAVAIATWAGCGCTARQVERDGNNFRVAACDMYTEQAIDNLIRAKTYQPFVQLSYSDLLTQTTDDLGGSLDASTGLNRDTGPMGGIMRTVTSGLMGNAKGNRQRLLSFHAEPVTDRPEVYEMYLKFAHDEGLFVESDEPPGCPVHIHRKRCKKHYWVPCEAGPMFQALVLRAAFQPAAEVPASPAYDVEIDQVARFAESGRPGLFTVTLKLKSAVPNGDGYLILTAGDKQLRTEVLPILQDKEMPEWAKRRGESTEYIRIQYRPADIGGVQPPQLVGLKGQLFSFEWPKVTPPVPPPVLQRIRSDVDRIRANTRPIVP